MEYGYIYVYIYHFHFQCLSHMCGNNFTMKFPPDFDNYTGLNGLVIPSSNLPLLHQIN